MRHLERLETLAVREQDRSAALELCREAERHQDVRRLALGLAWGPASRPTFERLCTVLSALSEPVRREVIELARPAIDAWPREICRAPAAWVERTARGEHLVQLELCRMLVVDPITVPNTLAMLRLAHSPHLGHITFLTILPMAAELIAPLLRGERMPQVRRLDLRGLTDGEDLAHDLGEACARWQLEHLDLSGTHLGDDAFAGVLSANRGRLRFLDVSGTGITTRSALAIADAPALELLSVLRLSWNELGDDGVAALASSPWLANVAVLELARTATGPRGIAQLAASPHLTNLVELDVSSNAIEARGAAALARSPLLPRLRRLDASHARIGDDGVFALAHLGEASAMRELALADNGISDTGVCALAAAPALANVESLNLAWNHISDTGAVALSCSSYPAAVQTLRLDHNQIGNSGAEALARTGQLCGLRSLSLSSNEIGDRGAIALASTASLSHLERLDLRRNVLTDSGAVALGSSPLVEQLDGLLVEGNAIAPRLARQIAGAAAGDAAEVSGDDDFDTLPTIQVFDPAESGGPASHPNLAAQKRARPPASIPSTLHLAWMLLMQPILVADRLAAAGVKTPVTRTTLGRHRAQTGREAHARLTALLLGGPVVLALLLVGLGAMLGATIDPPRVALAATAAIAVGSLVAHRRSLVMGATLALQCAVALVAGAAIVTERSLIATADAWLGRGWGVPAACAAVVVIVGLFANDYGERIASLERRRHGVPRAAPTLAEQLTRALRLSSWTAICGVGLFLVALVLGFGAQDLGLTESEPPEWASIAAIFFVRVLLIVIVAAVALFARAHVWLLEAGLAVGLYAIACATGRPTLRWSPILFDERIFLPLPFLGRHIALAAQDPLQEAEVQRALTATRRARGQRLRWA